MVCVCACVCVCVCGVFLWVFVAVGCETSPPRGHILNSYILCFRVNLALYCPCHYVIFNGFRTLMTGPYTAQQFLSPDLMTGA